MNFPKEVVEKVCSLLQDIGATDQMELKEELSKISDAQSIIWHLPESLKYGKVTLDPDQLELVIRGVCRMEAGGGFNVEELEVLNKFRFGFGSTTAIPRLLERFKKVTSPDSKVADALTDWIFSNRLNNYAPFGYQIPIGINSRREYATYEDRRAKHRAERRAIDQEVHRAAMTRKVENARLHAERSAANRQNRR